MASRTPEEVEALMKPDKPGLYKFQSTTTSSLRYYRKWTGAGWFEGHNTTGISDEMAIKGALGRITRPDAGEPYVRRQLREGYIFSFHCNLDGSTTPEPYVSQQLDLFQ